MLRTWKLRAAIALAAALLLALAVPAVGLANPAGGAGHAEAEGTPAGHSHEAGSNAAQVIAGLLSGGMAFIYITLAAMLPLLWVLALTLHLARPYMLRTIKKFYLRFGADVWWLLYVMIRDAVMVLTFVISVFFLFPDQVRNLALPVTGPLATVVLFWALLVKLTRDADDNPRDFAAVTYLMVAGAVLYLTPFLFGVEAPMRGWEEARRLASSSTNPEVALPILYGALGLFGLTGAYIFRFVMQAAAKAAAGGKGGAATLQGPAEGTTGAAD